MKRLILLAVVLSVGMSLAGWRGRFDEQFAAATASWTPASLNPIAWYKGDGDALDATGNYDGIWYGTEAYADGPTGQAFDFDESYIKGLPGLPHAGPFTISAWIRPIADSQIIVADTWGGCLRLASNNRLQFTMPGTGSITSTVCLEYKQWSHAVVVRDGTNVSLYTNTEVFSGVIGGGGVGGFVLAIGGASTGRFFAGQIDDVLIFDRALTPLEISTLYNESINKNGEEW